MSGAFFAVLTTDCRYTTKQTDMTTHERGFWKVSPEIFVQSLETDSFIYRYYINADKQNIGLFYDKLTKCWDSAYVSGGRIYTHNKKVNRRIHELVFAA